MSPGRWVTTEKAKEILGKLQSVAGRAPTARRKFTESTRCDGGDYMAAPSYCRALRSARSRNCAASRPSVRSKFCLVKMEVAATEPDMVPVVEQLKLDDVRRILGSVNDLELALTHVPDAFPGRANKWRGVQSLATGKSASFETSPKWLGEDVRISRMSRTALGGHKPHARTRSVRSCRASLA